MNTREDCATVPDPRNPLDVAYAIAARFMRIKPRPTYMYSVGLLGVLELYEVTRDMKYLDFYLAHAGAGPRFDWWLYRATGDSKWLTGAEAAGEQFLADARRDREGALLDPRGRYTIDILSHYFATPVIYGHVLKDARYFDEAWRQFEINRGYLEDPQTGIWYSRWGHCLHPNRPNPGLWGRGNGWLVAVWGRVAHLWDPSHSDYRAMLEAWCHYGQSLAAWQSPSGLFRQLLNRQGSFEDATVSGLFLTGMSCGVCEGTLPESFGEVAWRTFCGLRGIVDCEGNIHNASTYAGGYNFERQYHTCARFNEPHGDGTVLSGCVHLHALLQQKPALGGTPAPAARPVVITLAVPGMLTTEPPEKRKSEDLAGPVAARALKLQAIPPRDLYGSLWLGLLHGYDSTQDAAIVEHVRTLLSKAQSGLPAAVHWNTLAELALRGGAAVPLNELRSFLDTELKSWPRDRAGLWLDSVGGYSVDTLYLWLPLLAKAAVLLGDNALFDEACRQLLGYRRWLEDPITHLWYSCYGHGRHARRVTPGLWALGNGYCLAGVVGLLDHLPRSHVRYVDLICLLRRHVEVLHEYLPVSGGWSQVMDRLDSFPCVAATGLLTYGCAKAIVKGWVEPEYFAAASGGIYHLGAMIDGRGQYDRSSLPTGGLDTVAEYESHHVTDDDGALGMLLSGCAWGAICMQAKINPDELDHALGAR